MRREQAGRIALEAAARGLVSGTLAEWPVLLRALRRAGKRAHLRTTARQARAMARAALLAWSLR